MSAMQAVSALRSGFAALVPAAERLWGAFVAPLTSEDEAKLAAEYRRARGHHLTLAERSKMSREFDDHAEPLRRKPTVAAR